MLTFRKAKAPAAAVVLALTLASCGGDDTDGTATAPDPTGAAPEETVDDSPFTYAGDDRAAFLEECAAEEGGVTWYTSLAGKVVDAMVGAFEEQHPDITVEVFRGEQTDIVSRVVQESQAGRLQGDVVEVTSDGFRVLADQGVLAPFETPSAEGHDERFMLESEDGGTLGIGDRASYVGFAYNTNSLSPDAVPQELQDLLDPALEGKLAITSSTTGIRFVGNALHALGEEEGEAFLRDLAEQGVRVEAVSGAARAGLISAGEVASSPGIFRNHAQQEQENGAPVEWVPLEPVTANVGYAGVFEEATSPCSGMLFLDFLLGDPGTEVYEGLQYPRPSEDLGFEVWVPDESFETTEAYSEAFARWSSLFDELFAR